jgi:hypothetical protein
MELLYATCGKCVSSILGIRSSIFLLLEVDQACYTSLRQHGWFPPWLIAIVFQV